MSKLLITRNNLGQFVNNNCLMLEKYMLLSPGAADQAKKQGIQVFHSSGNESQQQLADRISRILKSKFNIDDEKRISLIKKDVFRRLNSIQ